MPKGRLHLTLMLQNEDINRLHKIVDALLGRRSLNALARLDPPFNVSKPNLHDSKAEFQHEFEAVQRAFEGLDQVLQAFLGRETEEEAAKRSEMTKRVAAAVDASARRLVGELDADNITNMLRKNAMDRGLFWVSLSLALDLRSELYNRIKELRDQQRDFWSVPNRPPNYYARTVALRLARLYARETGNKPTFGLARDGGHPSTDFGRALEQVFDVLKIKAKVRRPAEWAISQLTEEDFRPPLTGDLGGLLGITDSPDEDSATSAERQITPRDLPTSKGS